MQGNMLLGDEASADAGAEVLVKEAGDLLRRDVATALEEALGKDGDSVGVGGDELGEDVCKADLVVRSGDGAAVDGSPPVRKEDGERVEVIVVYARDVWVGDDNVGEVAKGGEAMGEANGEEREGKVGGGEKGSLGERRTAVSSKTGRVSFISAR